MGYDGIAAIAELGASLKGSNPPNSLVQTWPAVMRETISILQRRVLLDPISALRHVIRQCVRARTEQLMFLQQQQAQQQQVLIDQMQAQDSFSSRRIGLRELRLSPQLVGLPFAQLVAAQWAQRF